MSNFLKSIQPTLNEIVYDITGLALSDRFNPYKKLFEDSIVHRSNINIEKCKVEKNYQGLKEKYIIHAQDKKADLLQFLVKRFNNRPILDHSPESEFHQACLQLIISLAQRPLEVKLDNFSDLVQEQIEEATFDWPAYLLGNQNEQLVASIDWNEEESIDENDDDNHNKLDSTYLQNNDSEEVHIESKLIDDIEQQNYSVLDREIISSYWHQTLSDGVSPSLRDFALFWDQTMIKTTHLAYRVNSQTLTEYILIRETLWLLMDSTQLHIYAIDENNQMRIADFVRLCDVTPVAIQDCLEKFTKLSNQLRLANQFLKDTHHSCRTLSSFAQALQEQINLIRFQLADVERNCLKQSCTYTVLSFHEELDSLGIISKGICIERIFDQISFYNNKSNYDLTLELIHVLYKNLLMSEMINNLIFFNFLLPLFISSCRTYLEIIQNWLVNGFIDDHFDEFFIKRKADIHVESIDFWQLSYTEQVENASLIPKWLACIVPSLVKAGKCAEILKSNGVLRNNEESQSFVGEFSKYLQEHFNLKNISWNPLSLLNKSEATHNIKTLHNQFISFQLPFDDDDDKKNSFLALAFNHMETPKRSLLDINRQQLSLASDINQLTTIECILQNFSQEILLTRSNQLIDQLTNDILNRMKYLKHIEYIRDFFLFENGSFMHQFALRLYSKLSQAIHERLDAFSVLVSFDSTLTMFGLDKVTYPLSVIYQSSNTPSTIQKYIIQNVELKYDLPKELFIIIKPEQMEIYQKCFAFVLQVKQAKYVLDQLVFSEFRLKSRLRNQRLYRHQSYHLHHEMFLLRARLLHAVNAVNNFVLITFHTAGEQFVEKHSNKSIDIESMIMFHEKFLTALSIGSLLQPKQQAIRDHLMKLFEIVTIFARRWQLGFDSIKMEHITKLKTEFNQTKQFISIVLKPFLPRMIDSPLRALACSLQDDFYSNV
ncbi:unnamed protein product [Rotaria socialis]|uniref:Gamma-tubulin complex component n=1 Tax=Rotaria socialis TaxID=392032 RepID=A0A818TJD8_9BILA|nr:unnamed protein product [Rotaria socialis]CAF3770672.1 unnamed protein product [Rotaria socialis]CAF4568483.1 unnamed protein product [Rotaria socialis]CAF4631688.1 unnamed protein product [Rotaria socialis]